MVADIPAVAVDRQAVVADMPAVAVVDMLAAVAVVDMLAAVAATDNRQFLNRTPGLDLETWETPDTRKSNRRPIDFAALRSG